MSQTTTRAQEAASRTYRIDPIGALVGYATVCADVPDSRSAARHPRNRSQMAFVPSCPFEWPSPTSNAAAPAADLAITTPDEDIVPRAQGQSGQDQPEQKQSRSRLARLWSCYVAWRESRRAAAAWEMLDARTLRDIGVLPDELDHGGRSAASWGWYTTL
jgi:uncharacterized protein YjiS (DUF1127 family)